MLWFDKLMVRFFMSLDTVLFNFIATLYDLLIAISRTSILTQGDIASFVTRIEILLGIFMLFKVSFSLITYVVNPDDFSDKSKGFGKLIQNSVISLVLLVLVPYIFQMAFNLQAKILDDNVLAKLLLGEKINDNTGSSATIIDTAGNQMAFYVMLPFFSPNYAVEGLSDCMTMVDSNGFTDACREALDNAGLHSPNLENYTYGIQNKSLGLTFRANTALAITNEAEEEGDDAEQHFVIAYQKPLSTVTAVVVCLLLISFCIDIGVRSVKLAFLQLIYPIPVISYMDPKSGKDGMFSKWYKMCLSTFLSLFIRLLALYFGIYIITKVADFGMYDIINGSQITNGWVKIFVIIGVLMFVKQLPKILENMGVKIDGDGKFSLNPLKRVEEEAALGKRITGAAAGFAIGAAGNKGNPLKAASGLIRGAVGNQGFGATAKHQADVNRQLRQAKLDGSTLGGRLNARWTNLTGAKGINNVEKARKRIDALNETSGAISKMEERAIEKIKSGEAGSLSQEYLARENRLKAMQKAYEDGKTSFTDSSGHTFALNEDSIASQQMQLNNYLNNDAKYSYMDAMISGTYDANTNSITYTDKNGVSQTINDLGVDKTFKSQEATWRSKSKGVKDANVPKYAEDIHGEMGRQKGQISELDNQTRAQNAANEANQKYVEAAKWKK